MISARFRIQLPEHLWVSELSREFPQTEFRLLSGYRMDDRAVELGEVVGDSPGRVVAAMDDHRAIEGYELLEADSRRVLGKYETTQTALYDFVEASELTIEFPVDVDRGWYTFDLTGTRDELDELEAVLSDSPLSYELQSLVTRTDPESLLTDRQREVLETAVRNGYFSVPRECTLAELAERLDIDKSTASTILRRGEQRLVNWFLAGPESAL
ncbi:helix-turn-helix domain-containing protein [Halovenus sp. HT40]|uniref:helix-turn-helix domain-containing protein n=1 Tax=Halovenus sp. HT40 TaxID=3126691 RepID=UPI00300F129F